MMKRPIGLRCGTTLVQPHRLMELLPCIAETSPDTMARSIMTLSVAQARSRPGCINELQSVLQAQVDEEMLLCPVKRAALAVLWASYNVQESGLSVANSLGEAAGLEGRYQWGLILPSSARVSLVTYQTVIAVRYPDLVHIDSGEVSYGMFFSADPGQAGGFLPIVWDVPGTDMEAADAIKVVTSYLREKFEFGTEAADSLTVLHNRTNMVRVFGNSVTVKNSGGETRTRCVTSCAGSTAFLSVVAQTRRGFLSGFFFSSLAERAITAVPVTALPLEAIVTSSAMPRFHQAESNNKRKQNKQQPSKTNNATPTRHKPKTKHLSGNRVAYFCTTYN